MHRPEPASPDWRLTHHITPPSLLALAAALESAPADAVVVTIPASDFRLGTTLSVTATAALSEAVEHIVDLCHDLVVDGA